MEHKAKKAKMLTKAKNKYNAEHYDLWLVRTPKDEKLRLQLLANNAGYKSLNEFILDAIYEKEKRIKQFGAIDKFDLGYSTGRKLKKIDKGFPEKYKMYKEKNLTKTQFAKDLNISRPTLNRLIREFENIIATNKEI